MWCYASLNVYTFLTHLVSSDRMQKAPPSTYYAVDYFDAFCIKDKRKEVERCGSFFTYLVNRAVHIKVADSLDTDSLLWL